MERCLIAVMCFDFLNNLISCPCMGVVCLLVMQMGNGQVIDCCHVF